MTLQGFESNYPSTGLMNEEYSEQELMTSGTSEIKPD